MADRLRLMLCCNSHRNGVFTGRCRAVSLADPDRLTLESPYLDRSLKCRIDPAIFGLGVSKRWRHYGHAEWVGNWCWDAVTVSPQCAAAVINFAVRMGYRATVGAVRLFEKVNAGEPLTAADLLAGGVELSEG